MIHPDCETCEMLDLDNPDFPCKLEETGSRLRCTILNEYYKTLSVKREMLE